MATTPGGRQIANFGNDRVVLPSGGMTTVKSSTHGQITIEDGKLCVFIDGKWYSAGLTEIPAVTPAPDSDVEVSGAGTLIVNSVYANQNLESWKSPGDLFILDKITGYPAPDATSWVIRQGANILYVGTNAPTPWEATWSLGSFGTDPVPTVAAVVEPVSGGTQSAKLSKATAHEEKKEQEFLHKQAKK